MTGRRWKIEKKTTKNKKKHWLAVLQKRNLDQNKNDSKFKIIFFENIYMNIQFLYEFFLISDFLAGSLKASTNYRKRLLIWQYDFGQDTSLIFWTSGQLTLKITCPCSTAKNLSEFTKKFPANMFQVRKNTCTPPFLDAQNCILEVLCKKRRSKILSDEAWVGGEGGGGWIIPLKRLVFLAS